MSELDAKMPALSASLAAGRKTVVVLGEPYSVHSIYRPEQRRIYQASEIFAEDECGNWIARSQETGEIVFIDHETDDTKTLAADLDFFLRSLTKWEPSEPRQSGVISAWIDPDFVQEVRGDDT